MKKILVSYDLKAPGKDYKKVYTYFESFSDRIKPLESVYILFTNKTPSEIIDDLITLVDTNDRLLAVDISSSDWSTYKLPKTAERLNKN